MTRTRAFGDGILAKMAATGARDHRRSSAHARLRRRPGHRRRRRIAPWADDSLDRSAGALPAPGAPSAWPLWRRP